MLDFYWWYLSKWRPGCTELFFQEISSYRIDFGLDFWPHPCVLHVGVVLYAVWGQQIQFKWTRQATTGTRYRCEHIAVWIIFMSSRRQGSNKLAVIFFILISVETYFFFARIMPHIFGMAEMLSVKTRPEHPIASTGARCMSFDWIFTYALEHQGRRQ